MLNMDLSFQSSTQPFNYFDTGKHWLLLTANRKTLGYYFTEIEATTEVRQ